MQGVRGTSRPSECVTLNLQIQKETLSYKWIHAACQKPMRGDQYHRNDVDCTRHYCSPWKHGSVNYLDSKSLCANESFLTEQYVLRACISKYYSAKIMLQTKSFFSSCIDFRNGKDTPHISYGVPEIGCFFTILNAAGHNVALPQILIKLKTKTSSFLGNLYFCWSCPEISFHGKQHTAENSQNQWTVPLILFKVLLICPKMPTLCKRPEGSLPFFLPPFFNCEPASYGTLELKYPKELITSEQSCFWTTRCN